MRLENWEWYLSDWIADSRVDLILSAIRDNNNLLNSVGNCFDTPLVAACCYNNFTLVKNLVDLEVTINTVTDTGDSALSKTIDKDDNDLTSNKILMYLLNHGANPNITCLDGWSPLHVTAMRNKVLKSSILIKYGADINFKERTSGETPLHRSIKFKSYDVACLLLNRGAKCTIPDLYGKTATDLMGTNSKQELYSSLLKYSKVI